MRRLAKAPYTVDLHAHSTCSDGALSPRALVSLAARRGVKQLALTDHDTTAGLDEARAAGVRLGVTIIAGIELSVWKTRELHILGYFVDTTDPTLAGCTARRATARVDRIGAICARLAELGMHLDPEAIIAGAGGSPGRPHVARAMVSAGHVRSAGEAFHRFLGNGKPAHVAASTLPAEEGIALIHGAGGVAVLAHPGVEGADQLIPELAAAGLDGLECRHPAHDSAKTAHYRTMARMLDLCPTGGSDFHRRERGAAPGSHGIEPIDLARLHARRRAA